MPVGWWRPQIRFGILSAVQIESEKNAVSQPYTSYSEGQGGIWLFSGGSGRHSDMAMQFVSLSGLAALIGTLFVL